MTLNRKQQRVYEWLEHDLSLPVFAAAYMGATILLNQKPAGYISFVAHTGRDMMNYLASEISGRIKSRSARVDYVKNINELQIDWQNEWQFSDDLSPEVVERGHFIPIDVCQKISNLIEEHKSGQERDADKAALFFSFFLEYSDKDKIPSNFISEWKTAKRWFGAHAHLRKGTFREEIHRDLVKHFNCLDGYLYIAASSQYERLKEINEILDETNK